MLLPENTLDYEPFLIARISPLGSKVVVFCTSVASNDFCITCSYLLYCFGQILKT